MFDFTRSADARRLFLDPYSGEPLASAPGSESR
jgi:hypothetical protein